jgi:hypothetical protein
MLVGLVGDMVPIMVMVDTTLPRTGIKRIRLTVRACGSGMAPTISSLTCTATALIPIRGTVPHHGEIQQATTHNIPVTHTCPGRKPAAHMKRHIERAFSSRTVISDKRCSTNTSGRSQSGKLRKIWRLNSGIQFPGFGPHDSSSEGLIPGSFSFVVCLDITRSTSTRSQSTYISRRDRRVAQALEPV